ncbi:hypothetical protein ACIA8E_39555 [Streptomyces sp. NPDC051664]|uniref:hypothetical protein n=1 Tax=Streptomyces sp. NPDC051664 TaxID=3365668 RepID=UPI0037A8A797
MAGEELGLDLPVSGLAVDKKYPALMDHHYLIWSMTGRRASSLLNEVDAANETAPTDEIVFAPGTRLRVLATEHRAGATVVMLRELPESAPFAPPGVLEDADNAALVRLSAVASDPTPAALAREWTDRGIGDLGVLRLTGQVGS